MVRLKRKSDWVGGAGGNKAFKRRKAKVGKRVASGSANETKNIDVRTRAVVIAAGPLLACAAQLLFLARKTGRRHGSAGKSL